MRRGWRREGRPPEGPNGPRVAPRFDGNSAEAASNEPAPGTPPHIGLKGRQNKILSVAISDCGGSRGPRIALSEFGRACAGTRDAPWHIRVDVRRHDLAPQLRFKTQEGHIARKRDTWRLGTDLGPERARNLVVATLYNRKPPMADVAALSHYCGMAIHSRGDRNAKLLAGKRVLVVGCGNSAAEIALDLCVGEANSASMPIREPWHFI